jgi:tetratricopeptide (TPR) repeat protein
MALKQFDAVIDSCDAYLAREQPTIEVLEIRGLARVDRQQYSGAIADYTHAIELKPDLAPEPKARLLDHRGWAYQLADAPRLALDDFEASIRLTGDQADALAGRGLARIRLGDWRAAVADAEASVKLARTMPTDDASSEALRQAYLNAARIYALAVEFAASDVSREGERAVSRYRSYRTRALDLLQQALKWVPESERARLLEDPSLRALGRVGETHQIMH